MKNIGRSTTDKADFDFAEKLLAKCKSFGATAAEIVIGETADISVNCRNGKLENIERSENRALGLRVFVGEKTASISSAKFDQPEVLAERVVNMAKETPEDEFTTLAPQELLADKIPELDLYDEKEPSPEQLIGFAKEAEEIALAQPGITNSEGGDASFSRFSGLLMTSHGFAKTTRSTYSGISACVLAGSGTEMQHDYDYTSARHIGDLDTPEKIGRSAAERALAKMHPKKADSGKYPVVFDPRVSKSFLSDLTAGINGASIARGTSFLKNKLGEKIFADNITIEDDPHIKRGQGSRPFDGEGVRNEKLVIVENGILKTWLLDTRSANKLKLVTNGRAYRGVGSSPSPSSTNLYMKNGVLAPDEIISGIMHGIYITETFGMGINYITGDYSQGASGFMIEKGKITYPVNEITLAGNLLDIFLNITPANDLEFKYSTNAPTILVKEMTVAGK